MTPANDMDALSINYCLPQDVYTVAEGLYGIKFLYLGRSYSMKRLTDHKVYLKRLDKNFKSIVEMLEYIKSYNTVKGLEPLKNKSIRVVASKWKLMHFENWIDQYKEYLSFNDLNNNEEQIKAFYEWWFNLSGYATTPRHDLTKKS